MDQKNNSPLNLLFPQWQGSGTENLLYYGARKIASAIDGLKFHEIPVPEKKDLRIDNGILGFQDIVSHLKYCRALLEDLKPSGILTIGGDCGVEPGPVSYLNQLHNGDLALIWFDAHGDLNTPQSSPSGHFHGMPLRALCGESDPVIIDTLFSTLNAQQIFLSGAREFDPAERNFIRDSGLKQIHVHQLERPGFLSDAVREAGFSNIYVHIDLDVLDPGTYKNIKHPTPGGVGIETLCRIIRGLASTFHLAGLGIVEFIPDKESGLSEIKAILDASDIRRHL